MEQEPKPSSSESEGPPDPLPGASIPENVFSINEAKVLSVLGKEFVASSPHLASTSLVTPREVNEVVSRLEARNLIRRTTDRHPIFELTSKGTHIYRLLESDRCFGKTQRVMVIEEAALVAHQATSHLDDAEISRILAEELKKLD